MKDGITYIKNSYDILKENQANYDFKSLSSDKFFIISNDINYKSSLFHRIVGPFAFRSKQSELSNISNGCIQRRSFRRYDEFNQKSKYGYERSIC